MFRASTEKIVKSIKALILCENIDEMIISLQDMFNKGNITVEKKMKNILWKLKQHHLVKKLNMK